MNWVRPLSVFGAMVLCGCSLPFDRGDLPPNPIPDAKQQKSLDLQIQKTVEAMKGAKGLGISDAGPNAAQSGAEQWTVCALVDFPSRSLHYTFFVRGDKVIEVRPSVLYDNCETRAYRPMSVGSGSSIY